jgi:hypothetical protein
MNWGIRITHFFHESGNEMLRKSITAEGAGSDTNARGVRD